MNIKCIKVGPLETNCYVVSIGDKCLVIDPGDESDKISEELNDLNVEGIIITHHHFDHVEALDEIKKMTKAKVYDFKNLNFGKNKIGDFEFETIFTPGHKEDCISIYFEKEQILFSGDFIFEGTIGRWDLQGGDIREMKKSILKILEYPVDITVYPGHGNATTLKNEKENLEYYIKF